MTAIAGLVDEKGKIWMGADSAGVRSYDVRPRKDPKVFKNGEFLVGYTDSFRMGQLLRFGEHDGKTLGNVAKDKGPKDAYSFMVCNVVPWLRAMFKDGGYLKVDSNRETGGEFLIGFRGRLFTLFSDFQVAEAMFPYAAAGCGEDYALGSLFSTEKTGMKPRRRISMALKAAEQFSGGVCPPFRILSM